MTNDETVAQRMGGEMFLQLVEPTSPNSIGLRLARREDGRIVMQDDGCADDGGDYAGWTMQEIEGVVVPQWIDCVMMCEEA